MTTEEMIVEVTLQCRSRNSNQTGIYEHEYILSRLNKAQGILIDKHIKEENQEGYYEIDEVGYEIIAPFIVSETIPVVNNTFGKPKRLRYITNVTANEKNSSRNVKILKSSYSKTIKDLPYYKSNARFINAEQINNNIILTPYKDKIISVSLIYIENPSDIKEDIPSKFREAFHQTLCDIASTILINESSVNQEQGKSNNNDLNSLINN